MSLENSEKNNNIFTLFDKFKSENPENTPENTPEDDENEENLEKSEKMLTNLIKKKQKVEEEEDEIPQKMTKKQRLLDNIVKLKQNYGEIDKKQMKKLNRCRIPELEKILSDEMGKNVAIVKHQENNQMVEIVTKKFKNDDIAEDLVHVNFGLIGFVETMTTKYYKEYIDLSGLSLRMYKYKDAIKRCMSQIYDQHFDIIDKYMDPVTKLIMLNMFAVQETLLYNSSHTSEQINKEIEKIKKEVSYDPDTGELNQDIKDLREKRKNLSKNKIQHIIV